MELTHKQAQNRLKDISDELERLHGKAEQTETRMLNEDDQEYFDELVGESHEVAAHARKIEREDAMRDMKRRQLGTAAVKIERGSDEMDADPLGEPESIEGGRFRGADPWNLAEMRTFNRSSDEIGAELRARAFTAIERMQGMTDARREGATKIIESHDDSKGTISRLALATSSAHYMRAFVKASRGETMLMTPEEVEASRNVKDLARAMSLTDTAGGFLVPFQLDPTVIITSDGTFSEIRSVARQVVATGDVWSGVSAGATSWSWDSEASEVSDDSSTFAQPQVTVHKANGFVPISIEAAMDEANVTNEIGRLLAFGREDLEAEAHATGSGSGEPFGIVTALDGTSSEIDAATDDTFAIGDVYSLNTGLPSRYRRRATWAANAAIYDLIRQFDTQGGAGLWTTLGNDRPELLIGKRAIEVEGMDDTVTTSGAVSNNILVFGDFSNYVIADRIGMTVEFIPHLFATANNRPSGQRGWYAFFRQGADSVNDGAFRLLDVESAA